MKRMIAIIASIFLCFVFITVSNAETQNIYSGGGFAFTLRDDGTAELYEYYRGGTSVTVPTEVEGRKISKIGRMAFAYNSHIESVNIPDSIKEVGTNPFVGCSSLTEIEVSPSHPTIATIDGVLFSKEDKRLICYPCAFSANSYTIPEGILVIGEYAFKDCDKLESIDIPDSLVEIENNPFEGCTTLSTINVSSGNQVFENTDGVLFDKQKEELICYPCSFTIGHYAIPRGTLSIGTGAFRNCSELISIDIPGSITYIGPEAFMFCSGISTISIPESITSINDATFEACDSLISIDIPASVTEIGERAFSGCSSLSTIVLPEQLTTIGAWAFEDCNGLTSISIPESVIELGANPFAYCLSLTDIDVSSTHPAFTNVDGVLFNKSGSKLICYPCGLREETYTIPEGIKSIASGAFSGCSTLKTIIIPKEVNDIGAWAFSGCDELTLIVTRNSYAEEYCKERELNYTFPDVNDWLNN